MKSFLVIYLLPCKDIVDAVDNPAMAWVDEIREKIKLRTEAFRLLWITVLTVGGGSVGLLLGETTFKRLLFGLAGVGLTAVSGETLRRVYHSIQREIENLTEAESD